MLLEVDPLPAFASNKFDKYCIQILNFLWNDEKCLAAFTRCCTLLDICLGDEIANRDTAKDSSISDKLKILINETKQDDQKCLFNADVHN